MTIFFYSTQQKLQIRLQTIKPKSRSTTRFHPPPERRSSLFSIHSAILFLLIFIQYKLFFTVFQVGEKILFVIGIFMRFCHTGDRLTKLKFSLVCFVKKFRMTQGSVFNFNVTLNLFQGLKNIRC